MEVINTTSTTDPVNMYNYLNSYILSPIVFIIVALIIVAYYVFSLSLSSSSSSSSSSYLGSDIDFSLPSKKSSNYTFGFIIFFIILLLIVFNVFQHFFSINITTYIQDLFTSKPKIEIVVNDEDKYQPAPVPEIKFKKQVFNIPGNYYNYENAKALCKAYGADLASYEQIEEAYNKGAEWCNYGWSANQLALFPTQKQTYKHLQTISGHENDCGRPGINGGFIANPKVKFGVNCYGNKPKITEEEDEIMKTTETYPENEKDLAFKKRVDFWRNKVDEILVSPFNHTSWGSF